MSSADPPKVRCVIQRKTTSRVTYYLDQRALVELIRKAHNPWIPDDAQITVRIPGGGDWSNTDLDIDGDNPVVVTWTSQQAYKEGRGVPAEEAAEENEEEI